MRVHFSHVIVLIYTCSFQFQTPGSEFGNDSEMNMPGPRGLSSRVSVTSHGSGGGFSVKDGAGGGHKPRKTSAAGSATFSHSLVNLTQVRITGLSGAEYRFL